jgi:hypothetical protein
MKKKKKKKKNDDDAMKTCGEWRYTSTNFKLSTRWR